LAQRGLVPSYAVIIRELFPAREAGLRVSLAISTTLAGMALGGWLAGAIYDWTGSYAAALVNGIGWNIVNIAIVFWLLQQTLGRAARIAARTAECTQPPPKTALELTGRGALIEFGGKTHEFRLMSTRLKQADAAARL